MHTPKHIRFCVVIVLLLAASACAWAQQPQRVATQAALKAVVTRVEPQYPPVAKQLRLEGDTQLEVLVDENGGVEKVDVISGNPVLTKAASEAVRKWKFAPLTVDGKALKMVAQLTVTFRR